MGDPKFPRRSFNTPSHPWQGERIKEEAEIVKQYGLKNKHELWKAKTMVRNLRKQSRDLQARIRTGEEQAKIEKENLLKSCARIGLLPMEGATLDDVLGLQAEAMLGRRLQTIVFRKGFACSMGQARQFIVHGHVTINGRKVTIPGYIVTRGEEDNIALNPLSPVADEMHPIRIAQKGALEARAKKEAAYQARKEREDQRGGLKAAKKFVKKVPKAIVDTNPADANIPVDLPEEGQ
ncbi:MAG: 30S ribosomal protein S4 [Methanomassiliicoccales archaeon]|nr:MAG: 30S ribosomal protein S4 [Methanomassiliicoccales archaeon]